MSFEDALTDMNVRLFSMEAIVGAITMQAAATRPDWRELLQANEESALASVSSILFTSGDPTLNEELRQKIKAHTQLNFKSIFASIADAEARGELKNAT